MAAYTFMKNLNDAIPEYVEWTESHISKAIIAIEGLRSAITLTEVYYSNVIKDGYRNSDIENQLEQQWNSTVHTVDCIHKNLTTTCKDSRNSLLRTDEWLRDAREGFIPDFKTPFSTLGTLLGAIKGQHTRKKNASSKPK